MRNIFDGLMAAIGYLVAPLINALTAYLGNYVPIDIAKALVVVFLLAVAMFGFQVLAQRLRNVFLRLSLLTIMLFTLVAGVITSEDHIGTESFLFGPYVELFETYF